MKATLLTLVCLLVGCTSNPSVITPDDRFVGTFCYAGYNSALCLTLRADQTYSETFSGDTIVVLGPNGEYPGPDLRESGRWALRASEVILISDRNEKRFLKVEDRGSSVVLFESLGKFTREYRR